MRSSILSAVCATAAILFAVPMVTQGAPLLDLTFDEGSGQIVSSFQAPNHAVLGTSTAVEMDKDPSFSTVSIPHAPFNYPGNHSMFFQGNASGAQPQIRTAVSSDFDLSSKFTVQMWLMVDEMTQITNQNVRLIAKGNTDVAGDWQLLAGTIGRALQFSYVPEGGGPRINIETVAPDRDLFGFDENNVWRHLALTFDADANQAQFYFDGVPATTSAPSLLPPISTANTSFVIIGNRPMGDRAYRGHMDELRLDARVIAPGDPDFGFTNIIIPEPTTGVLALVIGGMLLRRQRSQRLL